MVAALSARSCPSGVAGPPGMFAPGGRCVAAAVDISADACQRRTSGTPSRRRGKIMTLYGQTALAEMPWV